MKADRDAGFRVSRAMNEPLEALMQARDEVNKLMMSEDVEVLGIGPDVAGLVLALERAVDEAEAIAFLGELASGK